MTPAIYRETRDTTARHIAHVPAHVTSRNHPYLPVGIAIDYKLWDRAARETARWYRASARYVAQTATARSGRRHDHQAGCHPNSDDALLGTINRYGRRLPQQRKEPRP